MRSGISTADLQYRAGGRGFDGERWTRRGRETVKLPRVDISVVTASSQKNTMRTRPLPAERKYLLHSEA